MIAGLIADDTRIIDLADHIITFFINIYIPCVVDGDAKRVAQLRIDGKSAIATVTGSAGTGDGRNNARSINFPDYIVGSIGDIDIPGVIDCHRTRLIYFCCRRRTPVSTVTGRPGSCNGIDDTRTIDFSHEVIITDIDIPRIVHDNPGYAVKSSR